MKKLKVTLVALGLLIGTTVSTAAIVPVEKDKTPTTTEQIANLLQTPNFIVDQEVTADVTFVINKNEELVVLSIDVEDAQVEHYIKSSLNYKKMEVSLEQGKEYKVPIRITSEK